MAEPVDRDMDMPDTRSGPSHNEPTAEVINEPTDVNDDKPAQMETVPPVVSDPTPAVKQQSSDPPPAVKQQSSDPPPVVKQQNKRPEIKNPFGALTPTVYRLVIWEKPVHSGIVLGGTLAFLIFTSLFSAFNTLCGAAVFIIGANTVYVFTSKQYKGIFKQEDTHPYAKYLDSPPELVKSFIDGYYDVGVEGINYIAQEGTKVVLVEDAPRSLKYVLGFFVLWTLGSWFSFVTLLGITLVFGFTLPIAYQKNKTVVDAKYEQAVIFAHAHTDKSLELAKQYCGDFLSKGKSLAASKLAKAEAEKKKE